MAKIKCPYKYPARSRNDKIAYICNIGGYSNRDGKWPIEFCVGLYFADLSFDNLWEKYRKENVTLPDEEVGDFKRVALATYNRIGESSLYHGAQEDCCRDISKDWEDTYHQLWDGTSVNTELSLRGRCGKHLVLEHFGSLRLEGLDDEGLYDELVSQTSPYGEDVCGEGRLRRGYRWLYDNAFIDTLYKYCVQCVQDFTPENASRNLESYAAASLFSRASDDYDDYVKNKADHAAVVACAQTLRQYLEEKEGTAVMQMLDTLSRAAGVSEEELGADI